jgi:hypothetical protein
MQIKKFWWILKYNVICKMSSGRRYPLPVKHVHNNICSHFQGFKAFFG